MVINKKFGNVGSDGVGKCCFRVLSVKISNLRVLSVKISNLKVLSVKSDKLSNYAFKLFVSIGFIVSVLIVDVIRSGYRSALKMGINFF